ncbi:hypothetical protein CC2G_004426 [Coprinopsis cinerea AmutBmut pab1-1]|nr:hypothetical protein CC2G_004426 [Coprinopsis cinerea AmutBmut pab1-1]
MKNSWSSIPFDIFEKILLHLSSDDEFEEDEDKHTQLEDVVNVSTVCRTWREHSVNAKAVWANLAGAHEVSPTMTFTILTRAGDHPLTVISGLDDNSGTSSLTGHHWDAIRANFHRVQTFDVDFEGTHDGSLVQFLQRPAPSLTTLSLVCGVPPASRISIPTLFADSAPQLTSVTIKDIAFSFANNWVPALQNVLSLRQSFYCIDEDDQGGSYLGLLRNVPSVQQVALEFIKLFAEDPADDRACYGRFETTSPIPLRNARSMNITGDLLGVTATLIRLDLPPSCSYHLTFIVDEMSASAGPDTYGRLDRIWVSKKYPRMKVVLCEDQVVVMTRDSTGKVGNELVMEMTYFMDDDGDLSQPFYAGFLASLSRQSHFRAMVAGVSKFELTFMLSSRLADENTATARDPETSWLLRASLLNPSQG